MDYKDYYKTLAVERSATQDEIKRAYRKLARKYHPDVSKELNAEERFKEVGEAYEVLKDPEKRAAYDQLGTDWKANQDFHAPPGWDAGFEFSGGGFTSSDASAYSDFFESLFGRGFQTGNKTTDSRSDRRGEDHHAKILIDLEDAIKGAAQTISLRIPGLDSQGHLNTRQRVLNVHIPKGIRPGQHIRLTGQGAPGHSKMPAGDLYLQVEFKPHPLYRISGQDLYFDLPLTPWEAALGATIKMPTPTGTVDLKIPPGSTGGRRLRLKGRGIPGKPVGDLYANLQIILPTADNEKATALYREMEKSLAFNPRAHLGI